MQSPEADRPSTDASPDPQALKRPAWVYVAASVAGVVVIVLLLGALGVFQTGEPPTPPAASGPFITISEPVQGAVVPIPEAVTVRGEAGALFENNVVVQALDEDGNVLVQEPTTAQAPEIGGTGPWSIQLVIPVKPGTKGLLFAFSPSPKDGSIMASASVEVTYGEALAVGSEVRISEPTVGSVLETTKPVTISGTGRGLFENNVVVEALDAGGTVLVQQPTTMQSEEVGGAGTWSISLRIPAGGGEAGTIRAYAVSPADGSIDAEDTVAVVFGKAGTPQPTATPFSTTAGIEDLLWSLTSLGGQSLVGDDPLTLDLTKGTASGFAGCNTYNGPYSLAGTTISLGPLASTRVSCPEPPGLMDQEIQFLAELQNAEGLAIDRNGLQLFGSKSPVTLSFHSVVLGTVGFLQSIEPAPGWALTVQLQDVSKADVAAVVIGETVTTDFSSLPVPYTIAFDPTKIDTRFNYAVSARITDSTGTLLFVNTQAYRVITAGNPSIVEVIVEPAN